MKKLCRVYGVILIGTIALFANENDVETKLEALKAFQASPKDVLLDYNPFMSEWMMESMKKGEPSTHAEVKELTLLSVLNQKAFISGKWYGIGDSIDDGKIVAIAHDTVRIKKGNTIKTLSLETSKRLLHVKDIKK